MFQLLGGVCVAGMVYLGVRMGLYQAMSGAGPLTAEEVAAKAGLHERWVREWLHGQASAGLLDYKGEGRFELSPEAAMVLAEENCPLFVAGGFCVLPQQMAVLERLPESFKTGIGLNYDALGPEGNRAEERLMAPWFRCQKPAPVTRRWSHLNSQPPLTDKVLLFAPRLMQSPSLVLRCNRPLSCAAAVPEPLAGRRAIPVES